VQAHVASGDLLMSLIREDVPLERALAFATRHNARRGYVMNAVTPADWRASYRVVPFVSKPDAPIQTAAEFMMRNGQPGIEKV
jgi:phosphodiesterase/alkaline phosphatase D-like protein